MYTAPKLDKENLPSIYIRVLETCNKLYQNQIAKKIKISPQNLSKTYIRHLTELELITKTKSGRAVIIALTHEGERILNQAHAILNSKPISYRIHNLWLTFPLRTSQATDTTRLVLSRGLRLTSSKALANHTDSYFIMDGYEACLSPSSIQLHLPDLDNLPLDVDLRGATMGLMAKLEPIIMKLEDKLGLKVVRIDRDTIVARISQLHIALKNHQFAETINERGEKLYVYVDNVLRVVVDKSHGLHEYEAVNAHYAIADGEKLGKLSKATITGNFDYEKVNALLDRLAQITETNARQIGQFAEQMNIHAPVFVAIEEIAKGMTSPTKRHKAQRAIQNLRQRRLL